MTEGFGDRLVGAIATTSPLCVGVDPSSALLAAWGLEDSAAGVSQLSMTVLEAVSDVAAAIKPQVAFFERHGSAGLAALEGLLAEARGLGVLVVADAKRGDIDSTMAAYGDAWLRDESPLAADALTITAYLGFGAMAAVVDQARRSGRGLFCVVASSNPEGRSLQEANTASGLSVEASLLAELAASNASELVAGAGLGSLGAVVGATRSVGNLDLASLRGPYLVPGVGAQGATAHDVGRLFEGVTPNSVLVNASRSILAAGPSIAGLRSAARALADELRAALG
jgi:orotidine-5'-phosphate decarboxylase